MKKVFLLLAMAMAISFASGQQPPPEKLKKDTVLGVYLSDSTKGTIESARLIRVQTLVKQFVQPSVTDPNKADSVIVHTTWTADPNSTRYYLLSNPKQLVHAFFDFEGPFWPANKIKPKSP